MVEDDDGHATLIRDGIAEAGGDRFVLERVARLSDGTAKAQDGGFDVILLDLTLPDSEGMDTLARMKSHTSDIPIVVMTSMSDEALAVRAVQEGAQDYLVKGQVEHSMLVRCLRYAIERQRTQLELRGLSLIDDLTGLYNRRGFYTACKERASGLYLVVLIDVDDLKRINDSFGHDEGDRALIETAKVMRDTFRETDVLGRLGGDEFGVLASGASADYAEFLMRRLKEKVASRNSHATRSYQLSLSAGTAAYVPDRTVEELLALADQQMYDQKKHKRDGP